MDKNDIRLKIRQILDEQFQVDEMFGLSGKEKAEKQLKLEVEQALKEVSKHNIGNVWAQPSGDRQNEKDVRELMNIRLNMAKNYMPTVEKLLPNLFDPNQKINKVYHKISGNNVSGIIPSNFYDLIITQEGGLPMVDGALGKENLSKELITLLGKEKSSKPSTYEFEVSVKINGFDEPIRTKGKFTTNSYNENEWKKLIEQKVRQAFNGVSDIYIGAIKRADNISESIIKEDTIYPFPLKTKMVIWSHLSDIQDGAPISEDQRRIINFVKLLVNKLEEGVKEMSEDELNQIYAKTR